MLSLLFIHFLNFHSFTIYMSLVPGNLLTKGWMIVVQNFKNFKVLLLIFRKDCNYVGHKQILSCCLRKQCFNWRCSVQRTCIVLKFKKGNSFASRVHFYSFWKQIEIIYFVSLLKTVYFYRMSSLKFGWRLCKIGRSI